MKYRYLKYLMVVLIISIVSAGSFFLAARFLYSDKESQMTYPGIIEIRTDDGIYQYDSEVISRSDNKIHKMKETGLLTSVGAIRSEEQVWLRTTRGVVSFRWNGSDFRDMRVGMDIQDKMHPNAGFAQNKHFVFYDGNGVLDSEDYETRWCKARKGDDLTRRTCVEQSNVAPYAISANEVSVFLFQDTSRLKDGTSHMIWQYDVETMKLIDTYDVSEIIKEEGLIEDMFWYGESLHLVFPKRIAKIGERGELSWVDWSNSGTFINYDYVGMEGTNIFLWQGSQNEDLKGRLIRIDMNSGESEVVGFDGNPAARCRSFMDHSSVGQGVLSFSCYGPDYEDEIYLYRMSDGKSMKWEPIKPFEQTETFWETEKLSEMIVLPDEERLSSLFDD